MLFGETVAVYCENRSEHTNIYKLSSASADADPHSRESAEYVTHRKRKLQRIAYEMKGRETK
jgi:hypothetical protein